MRGQYRLMLAATLFLSGILFFFPGECGRQASGNPRRIPGSHSPRISSP